LAHIPSKDIQTQQKQRLSPCGTKLLSFFLSKTLTSGALYTKKMGKGLRLSPYGLLLCLKHAHECHRQLSMFLAQAVEWVRRCFRRCFRFRFRLRCWRSVGVGECELHGIGNALRNGMNCPCVASFPALALVLSVHAILEASDYACLIAKTLCEIFRDLLDGFSVKCVRHVILRKCVSIKSETEISTIRSSLFAQWGRTPPSRRSRFISVTSPYPVTNRSKF